MDTTRRTFLTQGAGALGLLLLSSLTPELIAQAQRHAEASTTADGPPTFRFLTQQEAADFDAFATQIIPADETPGAREAGAVYFADYVLSSLHPEDREDARSALALLRQAAAYEQPGIASFSELPVEKQIAVMKRMEKPPEAAQPPGDTSAAQPSAGAKAAEAFGNLRVTVLMGTFCDPSMGGNKSQIGWKLIGFNDQAYWAPPFGYYDAHPEEKV